MARFHPGVVGRTPVFPAWKKSSSRTGKMKPADSFIEFQYISATSLSTPVGSMSGAFQFEQISSGAGALEASQSDSGQENVSSNGGTARLFVVEIPETKLLMF